MRIIDISQPLHEDIPVWPGDLPFESRWSARIADGSSVNVGAVTMSLHTGTHADAPLHITDGAADITELSLDAFIGPAEVIEVPGKGPIKATALDSLVDMGTPRILFKTRYNAMESGWADDFAHLSTELCRTLVQRGTRLVGIDTPSVDQVESRDLSSHHILYDGHIVNIENLNLRHVTPGRYTLIALPLALSGMDASPVRAVLIDE